MKTTTLREIKIVTALLATLAVPVVVSTWLKDEAALHSPISAEGLEELSRAYRENGIDKFQSSKRLLRKKVSFNLRNDEDPKAQMAAMNIAVYFFPELLHDSNLEKTYSLEHFKPLQEGIESAPGTESAQNNFEELRNEVWSYENPKQNEQGLSEYAAQMLKVYGALSWK